MKYCKRSRKNSWQFLLIVCVFHFGTSCTGLKNSINAETSKTDPVTIPGDPYPSTKLYELKIRDNKLYANHDLGFSVSSDFGETWKNSTVGCMSANSNCALWPGVVGYDFTSAGLIIASTYVGIYISRDLGQSWNIYSANPYPTMQPQHVFIFNNGFYFSLLQGLQGKGYALTTDGGTTWQRKDAQDIMGNGYVWTLYASDSTIILYTNTSDDTCLRKSTDGGITWQMIAPHFAATYDCGRFIVLQNKIVMATMSGVFISADFGATWTRKLMSDGLHSEILERIETDGEKIWVSSMMGPLMSYSTDLGQTWHTKDIGANTQILNFSVTKDVMAINSSENSKPVIYISKNGGNDFKKVSLGN